MMETENSAASKNKGSGRPVKSRVDWRCDFVIKLLQECKNKQISQKDARKILEERFSCTLHKSAMSKRVNGHGKQLNKRPVGRPRLDSVTRLARNRDKVSKDLSESTETPPTATSDTESTVNPSIFVITAPVVVEAATTTSSTNELTETTAKSVDIQSDAAINATSPQEVVIESDETSSPLPELRYCRETTVQSQPQSINLHELNPVQQLQILLQLQEYQRQTQLMQQQQQSHPVQPVVLPNHLDVLNKISLNAQTTAAEEVSTTTTTTTTITATANPTCSPQHVDKSQRQQPNTGVTINANVGAHGDATSSTAITSADDGTISCQVTIPITLNLVIKPTEKQCATCSGKSSCSKDS